MDLKFADKTIPLFCPMDSYAKVVKVVDGDTVHIVVNMPGIGLQRFITRLYGIDTPELRPLKSDPKREEIKIRAKAAKTRVNELCMNKIVYIKTYGFGKYGRLLISIYIDGICVNDLLMNEGHAVEYMVKSYK